MKLVSCEGWSFISLHGEAGYESRTAHYFKDQIALCRKDLKFQGPYLDKTDYCCEKCLNIINKNKEEKMERTLEQWLHLSSKEIDEILDRKENKALKKVYIHCKLSKEQIDKAIAIGRFLHLIYLVQVLTPEQAKRIESTFGK